MGYNFSVSTSMCCIGGTKYTTTSAENCSYGTRTITDFLRPQSNRYIRWTTSHLQLLARISKRRGYAYTSTQCYLRRARPLPSVPQTKYSPAGELTFPSTPEVAQTPTQRSYGQSQGTNLVTSDIMAQRCRRCLPSIGGLETLRGVAPVSRPIPAEPHRHYATASSESDTASLRVVPVSPSYFTGKPIFTDAWLLLQRLLRQNQLLPRLAPSEVPRIAWKTLAQYRMLVGEPVRAAKYHKVLEILQRLNQIHPQVMPEEVQQAMAPYKRDSNPYDVKPRPNLIDLWGRALGVGRRKASSAQVWLIEGEGEIIINGKPLQEVFSTQHDRESALWPLVALKRLDKYNIWATVEGGGTTGQAEAMTLGLAKALLVHEPLLKPALRRGK